jgi:hypothetical protein
MFSASQKDISQSRPYHFVKISVNEIELNIINYSNGIMFPIMDANVTIHSHNHAEKESPSIKLHEINHTTKEFFASTNKEYSVEIFFCKSKVTTKLSPEMTLNLINFLKLYKPTSNSNYCCVNFAYEIVYGRGKVVDDNNPKNFDELSCNAFSEEKLIPGDTVRLYKANKEPRHDAIFIGQNRYLSLFGNIGPLTVSTLDACKKGFEADTCVQTIKKKF